MTTTDASMPTASISTESYDAETVILRCSICPTRVTDWNFMTDEIEGWEVQLAVVTDAWLAHLATAHPEADEQSPDPIDDDPVIDGPRGKSFVTFPGRSSVTTSVIYDPLHVLCGACDCRFNEFDSVDAAERFARVHVAEDRAIAEATT